MSDDQFQILRRELGALQQNLGALQQNFDSLRVEMTRKFAEVEAKLDTKPDQGEIYRAILAVNSAMLAAIVGFAVVANIMGAFS